MKKTVLTLLCLSMVCSLAACGTAVQPAATPAPTAAATPAPTEPAATAEPAAPTPSEAPAAYPVLVPIGEEYAADLNGDGVAERICVSIEANTEGLDCVKLTLNGTDCTDSLYIEGEVWLDCPDPDFWAVTDLYSVDNLLEIAVQDWGPSSDYYTNFLRYDGETVYPIGGVEGLIWSNWSKSSDLSFEEDGFIRSYMRLSVLQTWFTEVRYELSEREWLAVVPEEVYYATVPTEVTVLAPLNAYDAKGGASTRLEAGAKLSILGTDNARWLCCTSEGAAQELWLHLDENGYQLETPDGYRPAQDVLDGLLFAD